MRIFPSTRLCLALVAYVATGVLATGKPLAAAATESPAKELLLRSIGYHDPDGQWGSGVFRLELSESRPDGTARTTEIVIDVAGGTFRWISISTRSRP